MNSKSGFTLIELLIYTALTSVLIVIFSQVFLAVIALRLESRQSSAVQQDARYIVSRLTRDIRRASAIQGPLFGSTGSAVMLTVPVSGSDVTYTYALSGTELTLSEGSASAVRLHSTETRVTEFTVLRIGNSAESTDLADTLKISVQLRGNNQTASADQTIDIETSVGLR